MGTIAKTHTPVEAQLAPGGTWLLAWLAPGQAQVVTPASWRATQRRLGLPQSIPAPQMGVHVQVMIPNAGGVRLLPAGQVRELQRGPNLKRLEDTYPSRVPEHLLKRRRK